MTGGTVQIPTLRAGSTARNCAGCFFWSQWLENTGDCMRYAMARRDAMIAGEPVPPQLSARCTSGGYVCDDFKSQEKP